MVLRPLYQVFDQARFLLLKKEKQRAEPNILQVRFVHVERTRQVPPEHLHVVFIFENFKGCGVFGVDFGADEEHV